MSGCFFVDVVSAFAWSAPRAAGMGLPLLFVSRACLNHERACLSVLPRPPARRLSTEKVRFPFLGSLSHARALFAPAGTSDGIPLHSPQTPPPASALVPILTVHRVQRSP